MLSLATCAVTFASLLLSLTAAHAADTERVLYSFNGVNVAVNIVTAVGLSIDASGSLYGLGGPTSTHPYGSILRLAKGPAGHWNMTVLYEFRGAADGNGPNGNLVFDSSGNLYGTTAYGGPYGQGTVFELTPTASGPWKETTLYSFTDLSAGRYPYAGVIFDAMGNLYGTASVGGTTGGCGTVFELSPSSSGAWTETTLHGFGCGNDGNIPAAPLVFDQKGNLYGTTQNGGGKNTTICGVIGCGTVFELTPGSGAWTELALYAFGDGTDGSFPAGPLVLDAAGSLYGTAAAGGDFGYGAVFELSPGSGATWTESTLYSFAGGTDGQLPQFGLVRTMAGNFYGVTDVGGASCNCGTVFELAPVAGGGWAKNTLYTFLGGTDGGNPYSGLVIDKQGGLYGATTLGGADNQGTIFRLFP
jgi:uncharacterized repeat protein (TIGR03803 family)